MQKENYVLRAHHGMCAYFFKGKGYSDEFTAHMSEIVKNLKTGAMVRLVDTVDVICQKCPENHGGACRTAALVAEYDRQVLLRCGLETGTTMAFEEFQKLVIAHILNPGKREEICGNCQWSSICRVDT